MICKKPYTMGGNAFGCGQCLPCRINRRRVWSHRITLEASLHEYSSFVTLTYSPEFLPAGATLVPEDITKFLKRLRKSIAPHKIRYFAVGEYGDKSERPHYHLALFGLGPLHAQVIADAWSVNKTPIGHIVVGDLNQYSAGYVAGYVTKKMTSFDDERLNGRHPEFARMSTSPGLGADAMQEVANVLFTRAGCTSLANTGDVPAVLHSNGKFLPLGRYLRSKIREKIGHPELGFDSPNCLKQKEELQALYTNHTRSTPHPTIEGLTITPTLSPAHKSAIITQAYASKIRSCEVRYSIFMKTKDRPL